METKGKFLISAAILLFTALASPAQTNKYLYSGSNVIVTLNPGKYNITAYGAQGGGSFSFGRGGLGAEMEGQFSFTTPAALILLVGGGGGAGSSSSGGGGGGGGSFVVNGSTALVVAGGGGGGGFNPKGGTFGKPGLITTSGGDGDPGLNGGSGGSNGNGGTNGIAGAGGNGGGYNSNGGGTNSPSGGHGICFLNGGAGGTGGSSGDHGGFGGGGGGGISGGGGGGGGGGYSGGGGGGWVSGSWGWGAGGGGSIIDSSAIADLAETSGVASPDGSPNGEIIITAVQVQPPSALPLFISHSGNTVTVYWQNAFGWSLLQNTNSISSNSWTSCSGITSSNGTNYWSVVNPTNNLFFRLAY